MDFLCHLYDKTWDIDHLHMFQSVKTGHLNQFFVKFSLFWGVFCDEILRFDRKSLIEVLWRDLLVIKHWPQSDKWFWRINFDYE